MSPVVQYISQDATLIQAARMMCTEHIHRLVVLAEDQRTVGFMTSLDLAAAMVAAILFLTVVCNLIPVTPCVGSYLFRLVPFRISWWVGPLYFLLLGAFFAWLYALTSHLFFTSSLTI